jgi:hypothetical protein
MNDQELTVYKTKDELLNEVAALRAEIEILRGSYRRLELQFLAYQEQFLAMRAALREVLNAYDDFGDEYMSKCLEDRARALLVYGKEY